MSHVVLEREPMRGRSRAVPSRGHLVALRHRQLDAKTTAPTGDGDIFDAGLIGAQQLPADVQPESGAIGMGGEERLEQLPLQRCGNARSTVDDLDQRALRLIGLTNAQGDIGSLVGLTPVAQGIAQQVPHRLGQLRRVYQCARVALISFSTRSVRICESTGYSQR